jgi:hypothetical protein
MVRLSCLSCSLYAQYRGKEACRRPRVRVLFFFFFQITEQLSLAHDISRRQWQSRKQVGSIHQLDRVHPQTTET